MKKVITNQQGFAVSGIIYPVFILFLVLIFGIVGNMASSKALLDRNKKDLLKQLDTAETVPLVTVRGNDITVANGMTPASEHPFDILYGIDAYDYRGNKIGKSGITYTSTPAFSITTNGVYNVTYKIVDSEGRSTSVNRLIRVESSAKYAFTYTGSYQTFETPKDGLYRVELWGAQGGGNASNGGSGGYTAGSIELNEGNLFNVFVGGMGLAGGVPYTTINSSGYNGGGNGGFFTNAAYQSRSPGGGGATDIRVVAPNRYRYVRDYIAGSSSNASNHWIEIEVYDKNNDNIALGKTVTGSVAQAGNVYSRIVDGLTTTFGEASATGLQYVEIDLGAEYEISHVNVRHYFADGRTYNNTQTILYDGAHSADSAYDIFDNGWSGLYPETEGGRINYLYNWNIFYDLKQRIMVAGGGGGSQDVLGGFAGALVGGNGAAGGAASSAAGLGGSQTAGGAGHYAGRFGIGGDGYHAFPDLPNCNDGTGGGGGYYGGGGGTGGINSCAPTGKGSGGGGSSYISGHYGSNSINLSSWPISISHSGNVNHGTGYKFTNTMMLSGDDDIPAPTGGLEWGHSGNGYALISAFITINN